MNNQPPYINGICLNQIEDGWLKGSVVKRQLNTQQKLMQNQACRSE